MPERVFWHPRPLAAPVYKSPDYPPLSACSGLSRAGRDQKPSNNRPLPEMYEDLARIVAMVQRVHRCHRPPSGEGQHGHRAGRGRASSLSELSANPLILLILAKSKKPINSVIYGL